jgi:hypothetical protein
MACFLYKVICKVSCKCRYVLLMCDLHNCVACKRKELNWQEPGLSGSDSGVGDRKGSGCIGMQRL